MSKNMSEGPQGGRPLQGYRQYIKEKHDVDEPVDKEEFQKILEIESATEAPMKKKRQQTEESEAVLEGPITSAAQVQIAPDLEPSPFEIQSPSVTQAPTTQTQAPLVMIAENDTTQTPEPEAPTQTPIPTTTEPQQQSQQQSQQQETEQPPPAPSPPKEESPTIKPKISPTPSKKPITETSPTAKTAVPTEPVEPKPKIPSKKPLETTTQTTMPSTKPKIEDKPLPAPKTPDTKAIEPSRPATEEIAKVQKEKKQKVKAEKSAESQVVAPTGATPDSVPIAPPQPVEAAPYLNLPPQLFELFDRMISYITIEHSKSGIQTTTVKLDMKNSVFHGAQIKLERFPSAPNTFNVNLQGSPEAVDLFNGHIDDLAAAFQFGKHNFDVNLTRASLLDEFRSKARRVTRKEDAGKGE